MCCCCGNPRESGVLRSRRYPSSFRPFLFYVFKVGLPAYLFVARGWAVSRKNNTLLGPRDSFLSGVIPTACVGVLGSYLRLFVGDGVFRVLGCLVFLVRLNGREVIRLPAQFGSRNGRLRAPPPPNLPFSGLLFVPRGGRVGAAPVTHRHVGGNKGGTNQISLWEPRADPAPSWPGERKRARNRTCWAWAGVSRGARDGVPPS